MSVVESLKQKEPLFSRRVQPDMPDGTIRHGAMLDYSCALVASERSQRNTVIATEKRKEEEKKITKEWNEQLEGLQDAIFDKLFAFTDQVSAALLPTESVDDSAKMPKAKKKKKKAEEEIEEEFGELPQFMGKANAPDICIIW